MASYIAGTLLASYGIGFTLGNFISQYYYRKRDNNTNSIPFDKLAANCYLSLVSYSDPKDLEQLSSGEKIVPSECHFYEEKSCDCQVYVWNANKKIFVIFRGTEHIKDLIVDIDVRTEPLEIKSNTEHINPVRIHQGFHRQFFSIEDRLTNFIKKSVDDGSTEMFVSGHSLGGALASIATYYYSKLYPQLYIETYTYGSPRVGDEEFANDKCHKNGYRVFNYYDPIPMIPITSRFQHVCATPVCINDSSPFYNPQITLQVVNVEDIRTILRPLMLFRLTPFSSQYHRVTKYNEILWKIIKQ
jgi:hypothetical protein